MGLANNNPTKLLAYDTFLQTEGALAGKTLPLGGTWAGAGDGGDFSVIAAEDYARRTEVSDANLNTGRYAVAGSEEPTSSKVSVSFVASAPEKFASETFRRGVFLRYSSAENWLMAFIANGSHKRQFAVAKRVAGTVTVLGELLTPMPGAPVSIPECTVSLSCGADGSWSAWNYDHGATTEPAPLLEGQDSALATGGSLAKGKGGMYDAYTSGTALSRNYDNFNLLSAEPAPVMLCSGKSAEVRSEGYFRQDESGTYYGEFPARGADLYLEPEGESGAINRLVLLARRNDVETEADSNVTDKISTTVYVTERFLAPR